MTKWQIDPEGVASALENTQVSFASMSAALAGINEGVMQPVVNGAGNDGVVASALGAFLRDQEEGRVARIVAQFTNTLSCTVAAVNAYTEGDELMASASIAAAASSETVKY